MQQAKNKPPKTACIWFDCALKGVYNPAGNQLGVGIYCTVNGVHMPEYSGAKAIHIGTVNEGEFTALIYALSVSKIMRKQDDYRFKIFGDSQVVCNIINMEYKCGNKLKPFYVKADKLRLDLGASLLGIHWIPREQNQEADKLSKEALL